MKPKFYIRAFSCFAILLCAGQLPVLAYVSPPGPPTNPPALLDQSQPLWGSTAIMGGFPYTQIAQTFTTSITGFLERVDLAVCENYPMEHDTLEVSIYTTLNGAPKSSLGSITLRTSIPIPLSWTGIPGIFQTSPSP